MVTVRRTAPFLAALCGSWVIGCSDLKSDLPPATPDNGVHGPEWVDTASANFHGKILKAGGYDESGCVPCHAQSLQGGTSGVSCYTCHASFPHAEGWGSSSSPMFHGEYLRTTAWEVEECASCHGSAFTGGTSGVSCFTCHASFPHSAGWTDPPAADFHGGFIRTASWDMRSCQDCHGDTYAGGSTGVSCRTCHNEPAGPENCTTCHGGANNAPPKDLNNNTVRSARGVGAHQIHVLGTSRSRALICTECHVVPSSVYEAGHVDTQSPAEVLFSRELARKSTNAPGTQDYDDSLPLFTPSPAYNASTLACSNTYCHGYFKNGNTTFTPVWNDMTGTAAACGTCHGDVTRPTVAERALPKTSAEGGTHTSSTDCADCHGDVVSGSGNSLRITNAALHINGRLNVFDGERDY